MLFWRYNEEIGNVVAQEDYIEKFKSLGLDDSDYNYTLWCMTKDVSYLEKANEQFPEDMIAFIERRVFLEDDKKEAKFNLAVALWCISFSNAISLEKVLSEQLVKNKIKELFD